MESDNKVVYIYTTTQGIVKVYNKLDAFENELADSRFLRCHQSYLVNMQYVVSVVDSDFILSFMWQYLFFFIYFINLLLKSLKSHIVFVIMFNKKPVYCLD